MLKFHQCCVKINNRIIEKLSDCDYCCCTRLFHRFITSRPNRQVSNAIFARLRIAFHTIVNVQWESRSKLSRFNHVQHIVIFSILDLYYNWDLLNHISEKCLPARDIYTWWPVQSVFYPVSHRSAYGLTIQICVRYCQVKWFSFFRLYVLRAN